MVNEEDTKPVEDTPVEPGAAAAGDDAAEAPETVPEELEDLDLSESETLEERLKAAGREVEELKDKVLRALAENENVRRRAAREREDASKYGITNFARDLLSVADNLGRALDALPDNAKEDKNLGSFVEGVELTGRELVSTFEKHGIKEVHPHGEKFDHNLHQAMFEVESEEHPHGHVTEVLAIGYTIGDRLLRPAMVGVSKRPKPKATPVAEDPQEETPADAETKASDGTDGDTGAESS